MEKAREEVVMRITTQFVAEQEAGQKPRLDDYARRYPQYVDEIADFVTYYYAFEAGLPEDTASVPALSAGSRAALGRAWERAADAVTLSILAQRQHYSLAQLAHALELSEDIVEQLSQRQLDPTSIPRELLQRLTHVLAQSTGVVRQALGMLELPSTPVVAEERVFYTVSSPTVRPVRSFREALLTSQQVSPVQKGYWQALLEHEGL